MLFCSLYTTENPLWIEAEYKEIKDPQREPELCHVYGRVLKQDCYLNG